MSGDAIIARVASVTADRNADFKRLKQFEREGKIELHTVAIEGNEKTRGVVRKEHPIGVTDSKFALIGECAIAGNNNHYKAIQDILGMQNHGDILHLERHIESRRDVFVTDDNDFLCCRERLAERFGVLILSCDELEKAISKGRIA